MNLVEEAKKTLPYMIQVRRDLHVIPEIGTHLPKTTAYVSEQLTKLNIRHEVKEDISCIFAYIGEKLEDANRKCVLLRADMDGLDIVEKSGEEFACDSGRMHACGHDLHAASLLGAAKLLKQQEAQLPCTVKLLFQSGEETFQGSKAAIEAGLLTNPKPDVAYACHVFAMGELNQIQWGLVPMGAVYGFKITLHGVGGHGSSPEICIDPINAGVQVYLALQSLIAREVPAGEEAALTIGQFSAGKAANIIPDTAVLQGTLRTFNPEIREMLIGRIRKMVASVADTYRCSYDIEVISDCPSVVCDDGFSEYCKDTLRNAGILEETIPQHVMGSEDFAFISEQIPSCFFSLGAKPYDVEKGLGQHHPAVRFNEDVMATAAAAYALIAMNYK